MREHLARVAGQVCAAAQRRIESASPAGHDRLLTALIEALRTDYADLPAFDDPHAKPFGEDRFAGLVDLFGLDEIDQLLLAIAVAPDLDANLASAYGLLTGQAEITHPPLGLALELAAVPTADPRSEEYLGAHSTLRRAGLIRTIGDGPRLSVRLRAVERVTAYLLGDDAPPPLLGPLVVRAVPITGEAAVLISRALDSGSRVVWVHSPPGTAGLAIASGAFAAFGLTALAIDLRAQPASAEQIVRAATLEAALTGCGLVLAGAEVFEQPEASGAAHWMTQAAVPVVAVGSRTWDPRWLPDAVLSVDAPTLTPGERAELWHETLGDLPDGTAAPELIGLRMTPEEIVATARHARMLAAARGEPLQVSTIRDAARALAAGVGSGRVAPRPATARASLADLVLPEHVLADLRRLVAWAAYRDEVLARGPVHGKGGKAGGIAALFTGSPGTGKTLAAHAIADELNLELFQVDLSSVIDKYIGETEKNLERIFHQAESRNVVLFFDEADALFGSRSEVRDARDRYANQEVSYLLQRMEHFDGLTVLATNLRGNLDMAFSRRMQFVIHFPDPEEATRLRLWQQHLNHVGELDPADPVDVAALAGPIELAGGDIRNIVLAATYDAVSAGEPVGMRHIRAATVREYHKLGRAVPNAIKE